MITIRKMTIEDVAQVSEMMCYCYHWLGKENGFSDKQVDFLVSERGSTDTIKAESQSQTYLIACMNSMIVGVAAVKDNEVAKLFVDPAYHGQDIGTMLFNSAQQIIVEGRYEEMIVGVMANSAVGFYEKMGMSKYGEKELNNGVFGGSKIPLMRKPVVNA
ncbi:MAG: GNAT family N-acetyltransferase [Planctomycetota bacterium]|jgi:ribosomal protein S18 acetylase RimI-like enzyme